MPRKQTIRIVERKKEVLELLIKEGELPTNEIVKKTNLSHSQEGTNIVTAIKCATINAPTRRLMSS